MDKKEIDIQIALGVFVTVPSEIAKIVRHSDDPLVPRWASKHSSTHVRQVAAKHPLLPVIDLVRLAMFETAMTVRSEVTFVLYEASVPRHDEVVAFLAWLEDLPQLRLPFENERFSTEHRKGGVRK